MGNGQGKPTDFNGEVSLNHFRLLRVVGRGAFGKVRIVETKNTGLSFALKYIRKDEVVRSESVRNIIRERRMLENMNHPFLCNLRYSFQDIEYMYLVVDLMSGGDLRFHISRKAFTEEAVRFWIAELGCALKYVHSQNIIHRDIKPDNVLLDADGHVHLTDFNVASDLSPSRSLTSKSGTLAYLAPEVYSGKGYDVRADWWSLGVLFYECVYNKRPFEGTSESTLSEQIQNGRPKYHITQPPVSPDCIFAISAALEIDSGNRLGHTWESFIYHDFFKVLDFDLLQQKKIEPIFVPSSDKTNFDATYDLEELLLEEAPLEARARRQKPRERLKDDASQQEIRAEELYRMIETDFKPYDYTIATYKKLAEQAAAANATGRADSVALDNTESLQGGPPTALTTDEATPAGMAPASGRPSMQATRPPPPWNPPPVPAVPNALSFSRKTPVSKRVPTAGGGVQMTLDVAGSWSDLARQDATLPTDAGSASVKSDVPSGVMGFFGRKRGRTNSPAKSKERGVLGKEGARAIIG